MRPILFALPLAVSALTLPLTAAAQDVPATPQGREALEILAEAVEVPTVKGRGNVPLLAQRLAERLVAGGFDAGEIAFTPVEGTDSGYLVATWPGRDRSAAPIVINMHMDVVEADAADWERDPFTAVIEDGFLFGRGAIDNKADIAMVLAALIDLRRQGWQPSRDLVLALTGDEETDMATTAALAQVLEGAEMVLNGDGGGGKLASDGRAVVYSVQAGEKTYADFRLTVTDVGGHSSRPGSFNAIGAMARALAAIDAHAFAPQVSPLTRAYWQGTAPFVDAELGAAMRALAADPRDEQAAAILSARRDYVGLVRTTCEPTTIEGGHAPNALPQSVTANVNCRIFPGTSRAQIMAELSDIVGDERIVFEQVDDGSIEAPESPLRADLMAALTAAVHERHPGLAIVPAMSPGATDSMFFRALGIPSYGVSASFIAPEDEFAHGLNERLPLATLDPGVKQWQTLLRALLD